jgi:hypothetical protein
MAEDQTAHRSRRALLAAAAGGAAALAAQAALPLTAAAANGEPLTLGTGNEATTATTLHQTTPDIASFWSNAAGLGFGLQGSSAAGAGIVGWSVTDEGAASSQQVTSTGVYGWAPSGSDEYPATGVWGDSEDFGVYGTGYFGVYGSGVVGVTGQAETTSGPGVHALGATTSSPALKVTGKVSFNRSGRKLIAAGKTSVVVSLAGVTTSSKIFAVMSNNRTGRYVRAVVPGANQFTIYLNASYTSQSYLAWFVID